MESAFPWNISLFNLINAAETPNTAVVVIARILAQYAPWLVIVVTIAFWLFGTPYVRRALMIAGVALGLGLATNFLIASATYAPRPFALGIGHTLLTHTQETSFPSDHATFLWSLGFALLIGSTLYRLGGVIFSLGLATAWARVYLGVHFPLDMAASFVISLLAAGFARALSKKLDGILFQPIERINAILLKPFQG